MPNSKPHASRVTALSAAAFLLAHLPALAADPAVITHIDQRPWIINAGGVLKSETELTIENHRGQAVDAWMKIRVPGKPDCMESLGSLPPGANKRVVHVPELTTDGDPVTFAVHDNAAGDTAPLGAKTLPQHKIRHWRLHVGHNTHLDIGYTDYQEDLKTKKWPGFWDQALLEDMPRSDSWPDDAKVRLEVEGVYQLDTSLPVRSADWFETMRERLAQGASPMARRSPTTRTATGARKNSPVRSIRPNAISRTRRAWNPPKTSSCATNRS